MVSTGDVGQLRKYRVRSSMDAAQITIANGVDDEFSIQAFYSPRDRHRLQIVIWPKLPRKPYLSYRFDKQGGDDH